jgi:hypothetical protein
MDKYKVVDAEQLDADLTEIADEVRILTDTLDKMTVDEITSNIAQANTDVSTQADIIAQIKTALEGKAAGGGGTEEIEQIIDQSGVLDSTEGTATEKIRQLLDLAYISKNIWTLRFPWNATLKEEIIFDCKKIRFMETAFSSAKVKTIRLSNTQNVTNWGNAFQGCTAETIETLDFSAATQFNQQTLMCDYLKNLKIVPQTLKYNTTLTSTLLTAESKDNIFKGLAYVEVARTLALPTNLKILQSQVDSANAKGWTVAGGTVVSEEEYYG